MDPEERELQIVLAHINAELQVYIAGTIGVLASCLALMIFGVQISKENFGVSVVAWITGFGFMFLAYQGANKIRACLGEFNRLHHAF